MLSFRPPAHARSAYGGVPRSSGPAVRAVLALALGCALACAATALAGCASSAKREARALTMAVDRFRHADAASRSAGARAVTEVACADRLVCEAKQACVSAIEPTARALQLKDEVAARLADIEHGDASAQSPDALALPAKLDEAERLLKAGRIKMADCERRLADLAVTYGS